MNEHSSALRATVIGRAARAIEAAKLQVIDRDWQSGEHRLDLVATPGDGILAAVEVRAVAYGILGACISATSEDRIRQLTAAREWMRGHDADYDDLWLVSAEIPRDEPLRRFVPDGGGWEPIEHAADIGMVSDFAAADPLRVAWTFADLKGRACPTRGDCIALSDSGWERCDEYDRHR